MTQREKASAELARILEVLEGGGADVALADICRHKITGGRPSSSWSINNRLLMWVAGTQDARSYKDWLAVGRQVDAGTKGFSILTPAKYKKRGEDGEEVIGADGKATYAVRGFGVSTRHPIENTSGDELPSLDPVELPPLTDIAERFGYSVSYDDTGRGSYGMAQHDVKSIVLGSHDSGVWFHELAHAAHRSFEPKANGGQEAHAEVVAETVAATLIRLYDPAAEIDSQAGYIRHYTDGDGAKARALLVTIDRVLDLLLATEAQNA